MNTSTLNLDVIRAQELITEGLDLSHAKRFVVGHSRDGKFSMLGYAETFSGHGFVGCDRRCYDSIARVEKFDPTAEQHAEFVPFYAMALRKEAAAAARAVRS